jgi:hypothetical protein
VLLATTQKEVKTSQGRRESGKIDLTELIENERIRSAEHLKARIEEIQEWIVSRYAGGGWSRSTAYSRTLVTSLGELELTVVKMRSRRGKVVRSPILDILGIRRRRYSSEVRMLLADMAARLSYGDTRKQFREITGVDVPKRTIHSFVQEVGEELGDASTSRRLPPQRRIEAPKVVMADGTKTHSIYPTQNVVKVAMAYDEGTGEKRILSIGVNNGWRDAQGRTPKDSIVVSDAEEEIPENMPHSDLQLDLVHAVRDSLYRMWIDGSSREERQKLSNDMKRILYTLVYFVKKHLDEDGDKKALSRRIGNTVGAWKAGRQPGREGIRQDREFHPDPSQVRGDLRQGSTGGGDQNSLHVKRNRETDGGGIEAVQAQMDELVHDRPREPPDHSTAQVRGGEILPCILARIYPSIQ